MPLVRVAVDIADAQGLAALSMRGVADRLGAAAMTPYRYVNGKGALVLLMADAVYGELTHPADAPAERRPRVAAGGRSLRRHEWSHGPFAAAPRSPPGCGSAARRR